MSEADPPDVRADEDLSVTRDPNPRNSPPNSPPRPEMSDADDTVDQSASQPKSHSSLPSLPPPPDDAPVVPGYHFLHKLGEGGMGVV